MKLIFTASLLSCILSAPSMAAFSIYNDATTWNTAAGQTAVEDFADTNLISGLTISAQAPEFSIANGYMRDRLVSNASTTFNFSSSIRGFGGNFDLTPGGAGMGIIITALNGASFSYQLPNSYSGQFFGFLGDTPFKSVSFVAGTQSGIAETYNLDNLSVAIAPVPEPETYALMGMGLVGLLAASRRKTKQA